MEETLDNLPSKVTDFAKQWRERSEKIEQSEISPSEYRKILNEYDQDYLTLLMSDTMLIVDGQKADAEHVYQSVRSDLQIALADAAGEVTGDMMDSLMFEVELDDVDEQPDIHFRWDDIQKISTDSEHQ